MIHPADKSGQLALVVAEIKQKGQPSEPAFDTWNLPKKKSDKMRNSDCLHVALRPVITLAQCFGLFPVNGIRAPDTSGLQFTWRSLKILYCLLALIMSMSMTVCSFIRIISTKFHTSKMTTLVFSVSSCLTNIIFLKLARKWPEFATSWEKVEQKIKVRYRQPPKYSLIKRFKIVTVIIITLAFCEHALSLASGYISARECADLHDNSDITAVYFKNQFPQVFTKTSYALWKGIVVQFTQVLTTFSWNFMDLFLILICTALTHHFHQLNERLYNVKNKTMPEWWWAEARSDYNDLANLTRQVDSYVADVVLLSFGTDLYFICIQLMFSFDRMTSLMRTIYLCYSFGFLLGRTTAVSLTAASVHDESLLPAPILYGVHASSYSTEVVRFLTQVTTDNIGLTGMKFFSITRSFVLTVAGTIVTYELVLVQFNSFQQTSPLNMTNVCEVK